MKHIKNSCTVVINLSLRSVKIYIFDDVGKKVYEDWLPVATSINGSFVEQDPNEWWEQLLQLCTKLSSQTIASSIDCISVTSSSLCLVTLDEKGAVIGKSLMVSDKRAEQESRVIKEKFQSFFGQNKSFKVEPSFMWPKILWIKRNDNKTFKKIKYFMSSNDFILYKLTGKMVTDELNAEKFYYSVSSKTYPKELLNLVGIKEQYFPTVVPPGTVIGLMKSELCKKIGSKNKITAVVSTYDALCALVGSNTYEKEELINVCGTCSSYRIVVPNAVSISDTSLLTQTIASENLTIIGGSNNLEGGVLEWAKECLYGDSYLKDDTFLYSLMQKEAGESTLGATGIIFIPYLLGERTPFLDPDVRGMFFGIERFHRRRDLIRSVFESTGFQARTIVAEFERKGIPISSLVMSGGVAKMEFAAQMRADIVGLPVKVVAEVETTALGAFIWTQKARGKIASIKEAKKMVRIAKTYIPNMHNHNAYSSLFLLYRQLYTANREFFKKRKEISARIATHQQHVLENL